MAKSKIMSIEPSQGRGETLRRKVIAGTLNKMTPEDWNALLHKARRREYRYNDVVLTQGFVGEALYVVSEGEVRVEREDFGRTVQLARLGPGSVFGEMSLLDKSGASANVVADGRTEILCVDGPELNDLTEQDPAFAARFYHSLATTLSRRLRATNEIVRGRG